MNCFKANLERIIPSYYHSAGGMRASWQKRQKSWPLLHKNSQESIRRNHHSSICSETDSNYWSLEDNDPLLQATEIAPSFLEIVRTCERFALVMTHSMKWSTLCSEIDQAKSDFVPMFNQTLPHSHSLTALNKNATTRDTIYPIKEMFNNSGGNRKDMEVVGTYKGKVVTDMILDLSKKKSSRLVEVLNYPVEDISLCVATHNKGSTASRISVQSGIKVSRNEIKNEESCIITSKVLDVSNVANFPSQITTTSSNPQATPWQPHSRVPSVSACYVNCKPKDCQYSGSQHFSSGLSHPYSPSTENLTEVDLNSSVTTDENSKQAMYTVSCFSQVGINRICSF